MSRTIIRTGRSKMTIPDFMPVLSAGAHDDPSEGACVMEYVSLLAGEDFSDYPVCTHPVLASAARVVNDYLPDSERYLLVPLIGRLFGTADTRESELDRRVLSVRLAAWCARRVIHLVPAQGHYKYTAAVGAAVAWADSPTKERAVHANAAANANYAANTNYAANAANDDARAAANAANYAAYAATNAAYAAYTADYIANAANAARAAVYAASYAANAAATALVDFLSSLLDYHAELTGHVARDVTDEELRALAKAVN